MGTWLGHFVPGTFFLGIALWWLIKVFQEYSRKQENYVNTLSKHQNCMCGKLCKLTMEPFVLILLSISGIAAEVITGWDSQHQVIIPGNVQHSTMYSAFGLVACVDLLQQRGVRCIPKGSEYMCYILALLVELVLFRFHLHGREEVDVHIHMLLVYTIMANIASAATEYYFSRSIHAGLARPFFTMLQGTWFIQIAFTLYNPVPGSTKWDLADMENMMAITTIYAWHIIGCIIGVMVIGACTFCCCSPQRTSELRYTTLPLLTDNSKGTGEYQNCLSEEEEDVQSWKIDQQSQCGST